MNRKPPDYFEPIRQAAERRWQQLEADPDLTGPWHQLFKQVQSPRHVLSELLQNADDAGATEASARVVDGVFEFTHNGEDFKLDHFASLCRFGYSNKRSLHTIGFRGIGFKSTFSLGPVVVIRTPSLSVYFEKERFTLPCWYADQTRDPNTTCILVKIQDELRQAELAKNLAEWKQSPVSLLFFRNIRRLTLEGNQLFWHSQGPGPISNSEWYALNDLPSARFLLARSEPEEFPAECLTEIKQERILGSDSDFSLPPSRVELVLGATAGIYVVLPTAVKPDLPFACNGPFMQDPARVKIKDPEISPTNRWLLNRVGKLAAACMCSWLANKDLDLKSRSEAYRLLPKTGAPNDKPTAPIAVLGHQGVESECLKEVSESFFTHIQRQRIVLAHDGAIEPMGTCIAVDKAIQDIWAPEIFSQQLDPDGRKMTCREIPAEVTELLCALEQVDKVNRTQVCRFLQQANPPHPGQEKLLRLWVYIAGELTHLFSSISIEEIAIIPIAGQAHLFPPRSAVRLGKSKAQLNESDIRWLAEHVLFVDREWLTFLADKETDYALQQGRYSSITAKEIAQSLLQRMGLADGEDTTKLIERFITSLEASSALDPMTCVRLAHICARLDCKVSKNFPYTTQSGNIRYVAKGVCHDSKKAIEALFPLDYTRRVFLADSYTALLQSCDLEEWNNWLASSKPSLRCLPPLQETKHVFKHARELLDYISDTYGEKLDTFLFPHKWERYSTSQRYILIDYEIDNEITTCWQTQHATERALSALARYILESSLIEWFSNPFIEIYQTNTNGVRESLVEGHEIAASWLRLFRGTACIPDTRGHLCKPSELLRRSEETEPLIGVERFLEKRFDHRDNEFILSCLGVSSALPGPKLLLSLLGALSAIELPPRDEVVKLYEQLDKLYLLSKSEEQNEILSSFHSSKLLLTEQGIWSNPANVFISGDGLEESGILTILRSVSHLSLWHHLGLRERPDAEAAIEIIGAIPLDSELESELCDLAKILMRRFTADIIDHCKVWISLSKQLKRIDALTYGLSGDEINPDLLFDDILHGCADLRFIDGYSLETVLQKTLICDLRTAVSYELEDGSIPISEESEKPRWLQIYGMCLSQLNQFSSENTVFLRDAGMMLSRANVCYRNNLILFPVANGKPIGRSVVKEGALISGTIYAMRLPSSRLASIMPGIIGDFLQSPKLQAAAAYCFERSDDLIADYFRVNYGLNDQSVAELTSHSPIESANGQSQEDRISRPTINGDPELIDTFSSCATESAAGVNSSEPFAPQSSSRENDYETSAFPEQESTDRSFDRLLHAASFEEIDQPAQLSPADPVSSQSGISTCSAEDSELVPIPEIESTPVFPNESPNSTQYEIVMEYAEQLGLEEVGEGVFRGSDQTIMRRQRGELFPWVLEAPTGLEIRRFLVRSAPIVASPLELDAVAFGLLERLPNSHSILIPDTSGETVEITGFQLQAMIADGKLKVFPSSYRLALT
jgi:hypothetical protein